MLKGRVAIHYGSLAHAAGLKLTQNADVVYDGIRAGHGCPYHIRTGDVAIDQRAAFAVPDLVTASRPYRRERAVSLVRQLNDKVTAT
jgi:hypothetical protein